MATPLLSILIPGVPRRFDKGRELVEIFQKQIDDLKIPKGMVEVIWLVDNYSLSVGGKRQRLVEIARGDYIVFMDDDDRPSEDYVKNILIAIQKQPDVITFLSDTTWNNMHGTICFRLHASTDERFKANPEITTRRPWMICAWKRSIALQCKFPELNWGEDSPWVDQATPLAKTEVHIPKVMHIYVHYDVTSESYQRETGNR